MNLRRAVLLFVLALAVALPAILAAQPSPRTLTVTNGGGGTVVSSPSGINCPGDCTESYAHNTDVTLTATPDPGKIFVGWSGGCTGTGTCQVKMNQDKSVTATFQTAYTLSVNKTGTGTGTVTSSPTGINCGLDCGEAYGDGTVVTLTAAPAVGSTFTGWSGDCTGTGSCVVTMTQARSVTATFNIATYTLTVSLAGAGSGTVTSAPAGIDCGVDCSEVYNYNTVVTLTAAPSVGSVFAGWSGGGCSGTGTCVVTMTSAQAVTATFNIATYTLTVSLAGAGSGSVTSSPAGIDCGVDCSEVYNYNTVVTLTAAPSVGSVFAGWSGGGCSGTGTCVVTMTSAQAVTATFDPTYALSVSLAGAGSGSVSSSPAGIDCGSDCSESYNVNTVVTLTATPATGSVFDGWSGDCSGTGTCQVTMDQAHSVTATFSVATFELSVSLAGAGSGSVSSVPTGIDCGSDCTQAYNYNTEVTLTATPTFGSTFGGWGGACTGTGSCVVTMTEAKAVTATFEVGSFVLTAVKAGDGAGTVTSSPAGIDCGADCSESYAYNTVVTLTATAGTRSVFTGWSGSGCSGTGTCEVTMNDARSVTATFNDIGLDFYTLEPCRVVSTTTLTSGVSQTFTIAGNCGVPADAKAVSLNVTAVNATSNGNLRLYPGDGSVPSTSVLNFQTATNRANNTVAQLATNGAGTLGAAAFLSSDSQTVGLIIDVNGYYK